MPKWAVAPRINMERLCSAPGVGWAHAALAPNIKASAAPNKEVKSTVFIGQGVAVVMRLDALAGALLAGAARSLAGVVHLGG